MTPSYFYVSCHGQTQRAIELHFSTRCPFYSFNQTTAFSDFTEKWLQNRCPPAEALILRPSLPALPTRRELIHLSTGDCSALVLTTFSLYCTQLPDKRIPKHDLQTALYCLFSTYGTVLDVVVMKTSKMRGQAHVVFKDVQASTQALRALQGCEFFGKQMVCFNTHLSSQTHSTNV
jgi:hypothetical protein